MAEHIVHHSVVLNRDDLVRAVVNLGHRVDNCAISVSARNGTEVLSMDMPESISMTVRWNEIKENDHG